MTRPDSDRTESSGVKRRSLIAAGGTLGAALFAGCSGGDGGAGGGYGGGGSDDGDGSGGGGGSGGDADAGTGSFSLLISDQPAAIGDFDSLNVSFEKARVFRGEGEDEEESEGREDGSEGNETADGQSTEQPETEEETETEEPETEEPETEEEETEEEEEEEEEPENEETEDEEADDEEEEGQQGFSEIPLDGATVDLTQVVGDKAISVFDGELEAGTYTKIELHASGVEGIVGGEEVPVKIPSEKLQIVKPFTVEEGGSVSFVFDINVVKKGPNGYNLLPVISESGVAGKDVEVRKVDAKGRGNGGGGDDSEGTETGTEEPESGDGQAGQQDGQAGQAGGQQGNRSSS